MTDKNDERLGFDDSAMFPASVKALVALAPKLVEVLQEGQLDRLLRELETWGECLYFLKPSEHWVAMSVAFTLRAELRTLHAEVAAETGDSWRLPEDLVLPRVRALVEANDAVSAFVDDCAISATCYVPDTQKETRDPSTRRWLEAMYHRLALEVTELSSRGGEGGPLNIKAAQQEGLE